MAVGSSAFSFEVALLQTQREQVCVHRDSDTLASASCLQEKLDSHRFACVLPRQISRQIKCAQLQNSRVVLVRIQIQRRLKT